jgi:hypothetical protein
MADRILVFTALFCDISEGVVFGGLSGVSLTISLLVGSFWGLGDLEGEESDVESSSIEPRNADCVKPKSKQMGHTKSTLFDLLADVVRSRRAP